jgi:hypothetical protein
MAFTDIYLLDKVDVNIDPRLKNCEADICASLSCSLLNRSIVSDIVGGTCCLLRDVESLLNDTYSIGESVTGIIQQTINNNSGNIRKLCPRHLNLVPVKKEVYSNS